MSELKAYIAPTPDGKGLADYYLKSEADKVIADKDKDIQRLEKLCESYRIDCDNLAISDEQAKRAARTLLKKMNHQKYKRCLAMTEMCNARYDEEDAKVNGCGASWEYMSKEMKYWERWRWRWDAIAENFKPNNSTAQ
jgi:hypothetical protein